MERTSVALRVVIVFSRVCAQRVGHQFIVGEKTSRVIANEGIGGGRLFIILLTASNSF